jgi:hypothetical protein
MKRFIAVAISLAVVFLNSLAFAAWTKIPEVKQFGPHSVQIEIGLISDGSASGSLNLNSILNSSQFAKIADGLLMSVSVEPGTGSVAPDGAYDVNVYDSNGTQTIDKTTTSEATKHTYDPSESTGATQQTMGSVPFDIGDIGSSGDLIKIRFNFYIP